MRGSLSVYVGERQSERELSGKNKSDRLEELWLFLVFRSEGKERKEDFPLLLSTVYSVHNVCVILYSTRGAPD